MNNEKMDKNYGFFINSLKKLECIDESNFTKDQKEEILYAKTIVCNELEKIKHDNKPNEKSIIEIQNIINKYTKYIMKEYYY